MFDDDAPPTKRLKINIPKKRRPNVRCANKSNNRAISVPQKMLPPQQDVRKRKMPQRRQANETVPNLSNLNQHILMELLDYLPLEDLMNLADTNQHMRKMAQDAFVWRARNGLSFYRDTVIDYALLKRVFFNFGHLVSMITITTHR